MINQYIFKNDEAEIYRCLLPFFDDADLKEWFNGAYFLLLDGGHYFTQWKNLLSCRARRSSHHSEDATLAIQGDILKEALFGTRLYNGQHCTWIQLERYSNQPSQIFNHMLTFCYYACFDRNVGPVGTSAYTEDNPRIIIINSPTRSPTPS